MINVKGIGSGADGAFADLSRVQIFNVANCEGATIPGLATAPRDARRGAMFFGNFRICQFPSLEQFADAKSIVLSPLFGLCLGLIWVLAVPFLAISAQFIWVFLLPLALLFLPSNWIIQLPLFRACGASDGPFRIFSAMAQFGFARLLRIDCSPSHHIRKSTGNASSGVSVALRDMPVLAWFSGKKSDKAKKFGFGFRYSFHHTPAAEISL